MFNFRFLKVATPLTALTFRIEEGAKTAAAGPLSMLRFTRELSPVSTLPYSSSIVAANGQEIDNPLYVPKGDHGTVLVPRGTYLRTRFSFHGVDEDELDVAAGVSLLAIERNDDWWVCQDETSGKFGLIPAAYVINM